MTFGRIIHGGKYMYLVNDNNLKKKSLQDNVYFTLRDIFANAESIDTFMEANRFNSCLANNICLEDRTEGFEYSNALHEPYFVERLKSWLQYFDIHFFEFEEPDPEEANELDMNKYMKFEDWWVQFLELRELIDVQYENGCMSAEDMREIKNKNFV